MEELTATSTEQRSPLLASLKALAALIVTISTLAAGYQSTLTPITLIVNGQVRELQTHQDTVDALLADYGITLQPEDTVTPAPETAIKPGMTVEVRQAHPVQVIVDGRTISLRTHANTIESVLSEAGVTVNPYDNVETEGEFPKSNIIGSEDRSEPTRITIHRAMPLHLHENGQVTTFHTTASTVGEALRQIGVTLYLADFVEPELGSPISANMHIHVDRSAPVTVEVDGRTIRSRTHQERVEDVLADLGVVLTGQDYTRPPLDASLEGDTTIHVVRVTERFLIEQEPIPFDSKWQPDPDLEIDHERLLQEGAPGIRERRIRVRYENGHEISRTIENQYVAIPPTTKIMGYGTKIVVRTLNTASGPVEYWRTIRMLATSYSAATSGTPRTSSWYGRTATGMKMRQGIVAVDPHMIPLRSKVYVPDYGVGIAGDTGGAIKGHRIDLGYDDHNLKLWYRWVTVYLLTPVPPASQIDYTLP